MLVDTSVWSLVLRRDAPAHSAHAGELVRALRAGEPLFATGLVLQELLQGFSGPRARSQIVDRFAALPLLVPDREDHIEAALLRNAARRRGWSIGTIDALLAQLCLRHDLTLLSADRDFDRIAQVSRLRLWRPQA